MSAWQPFPYDHAAYEYDAATLERLWPRLHAGDVEPLPHDPAVLAAWSLCHAGRFRAAVDAGLAAGGAGITAANKAQAVYANYLEPREEAKLTLFMEVAERAEAQIAADPKNANAHFVMAYALGRYGQGISITRAMALGLGNKVKSALETTIRLAPQHADAHLGLGAFHAEVIDKVGSLIGRTQGASKDAGLAFYKAALKLNPNSAIAMVECANGLVMLEGEKSLPVANQLYERAAAVEPMDAAERLDVEMARAELAN